MRILVVDDQEDSLRLLKLILSNAGYEDLLLAKSVIEAYQLLGLAPSSKTVATSQVDLILMDIVMPEIDGITACQHIKTVPELADIPIIIVTVHAEPEILHKAFLAGAIDYIKKPFDKIELVTRVRSVLKLRAEMEARKTRARELLAKNQELEKALHEVKILQGLIPICAWCRKIRDDDGYWKRVETYLEKHSDVSFTHGICPECMARVQADLDKSRLSSTESPERDSQGSP